MQVQIFSIDEDGSGGSGISNHTHDRTLTCQDQAWCESIVVLHLGYLSYARFHVKVTFYNLESESNQVQDIKFDVSS